MLTQEQNRRYLSSIRQSQEWAHSQWEQLAKEEDLKGFYKGIYYATAVGDPLLGAQFRKIVVERFLREDGDFRTTETFKGFKDFPVSPPNRYLYSNGWLVYGLHRSGNYDLARQGLRFIQSLQSAEQGGFYSSFDPETKTIDKSRMDLSSTSLSGIACLECGDHDAARRAGDFVVRVVEDQPQPDKYLFTSVTSKGLINTDVFGIEDKWHPKGRCQTCLSAVDDGSQEMAWLAGKPMMFLAKLYQAFGDEKYLRAAKTLFDFAMKLDAGAWENHGSCKTMWAGSELFKITGEQRYQDAAIRIMDFIVSTQHESGCWINALWHDDIDSQPLNERMDVTFEFMLEISDVIYNLNSR